MYEVEISPFTNPAQTVSVGSYADAQAANEASHRETDRRPGHAAYVFLRITEKTRLLISHTLKGN